MAKDDRFNGFEHRDAIESCGNDTEDMVRGVLRMIDHILQRTITPDESHSNAIIGRVESHLEPSVFFGCLIVGGNYNDGSNAGLSASNANNTLSNSNANIGSRLNFVSYDPRIAVISTLPNGRKQENIPSGLVTFNVKTRTYYKGQIA